MAERAWCFPGDRTSVYGDASAADEQAIVEISGLAEQAAAAAQAFCDSVQHVSLAAAALVLPDSEAR